MTREGLKILLLGYLPDNAKLDRLPVEEAIIHVEQMHATRPSLLMYLLPIFTALIPDIMQGAFPSDTTSVQQQSASTMLALIHEYARPWCWIMAFTQMLVMIPIIFQRKRSRDFLRERGLPLYPGKS